MLVSVLEQRRLRAPVVTVACGLALAVAVAVVSRWVAAVPVAVLALIAAGVYYWLGGTETDVGALIGSRPDERQEVVRLRVRAFAAAALLVMATVGAVVAAALDRPAWPYAAIVGVGAIVFGGGLVWYPRSSRVGGRESLGAVGARLDERQAGVLLHALQLAGIVMFLAAIAGGLALSGRSGADPLRILATAFAGAIILGFVLLRPRR